MRALLLFFLTSSGLVSTAEAAAAMCQAVCEIDLGGTCEEAIELLEFSGECCALQTIGGSCHMVTTENCQFKDKGADDLSCTTDENGDIVGCVPAYTVYYSDSNDPCPASEIPIPGIHTSNSPSLVPISEAPSFVGASNSPSHVVSDGPTFGGGSQAPSSLVTWISGVETDVVAGASHLGDCYLVERTNYDTIYTNDCNDKILEYAYYNGGLDAEYEDTGYEMEVYARIRTHLRSCPDLQDDCAVTVDGFPDTECGCSYDNGKIAIDMDECAAAFPEVFPDDLVEDTWTVDFLGFFGSGAELYQEQFYPIDCGDLCCSHPLQVTTVPSMTPTSTWMPVTASSATMELYEGDPNLGDCYTVERYTETQTFDTDGCTATFLKFTYYNGGVNGNYVDTGFPKEEYLVVEVDVMHDCDDANANPDHCTIKVDDGTVHTCDQCNYMDGTVTMFDCNNVPGVFAEIGTAQEVALLNPSTYEEKFFNLAYDESRCMHPALGSSVPSTFPSLVPSTFPSLVPISEAPSFVDTISFSEAPSGAGPSTYPSLVPISEAPSFTGASNSPSLIPLSEAPSFVETEEPPTFEPWPFDSELPSLVPSLVPSGREQVSSFASTDIVQGDVSQGDCYTVERYMTDTIYSDGCTDSFLKYTYYNGGLNADYEDTGFDKVEYLKVEVKAEHDCNDINIPETCSVSIHDMNGVHTCNGGCDIAGSKITMLDCSNHNYFPEGEQTVEVFFGETSHPYEEEFFTLTFDPEKCEHPAVGGTTFPSLIPSTFPSLVPLSEAPSFVGASNSPTGMLSSFASTDYVDGDITLGDCFTVLRELTDTIYTDGCTEANLIFTFYPWGTDVTSLIPGSIPEYAKVNVEVFYGCDDEGEPDLCSVSVEGVGTCTCHYDMGEITMTTCADLSSVLAPGSHSVEFFFDGAPESPYDEKFIPLAFDQDRCDDIVSDIPSTFPSLIPSTFPSLYPYSEAPSLYPYSEAPSGAGPSGYPYSEAPSGTGPSWYPYSEAPSGAGPSYVPYSEAPSFVYSEVPSTPISSALSCYDQWTDGIVEDGKCHAIDINHCVEEWADGCTYVTAMYDYYNQYSSSVGSSRESYYYVEITSASGCDPAASPDQPENGCEITAYGEETFGTCLQCFSDGDLISLVDCSNLADIFEPASGQIISISTAGDAFDVIETDHMCDHPSVGVSADRNGVGGSDKSSVTIPISVTLHYKFKPGKGNTEPDSSAIAMLVTQTIDYFHTVFLEKPELFDILMDVRMTDIEYDYVPGSPNQFILTLMADVEVENTENTKTIPTSREIALIMAGPNLNKYLHHYVKRNPTGHRNVFFDVATVRFKGVGNENIIS